MFERSQSRKKNRLEYYDYSQEGWYFVTVCTRGMKSWFGKADSEKTMLNRCGRIAKHCWLDIPNHFKGVTLDEFVVMPNHIHGIIVINSVGNRHACSLQEGRQYEYLPTIIGSYKSSVTRNINQIMGKKIFQWQKSFYDHIIRSDESLYNIRKYTLENPFTTNLQKI